MANSVLVIGATGNVGAEVVKALQQGGQPVRAAVHHLEAAQAQLGEGVEYVQFDFKRAETFKEAFRGVKRMFMLRPPDISNAKRDIAPAIEAAKRAGVEQIVFLSLLGVEKNPVVPHYRIEKLIMASGLRWTFLRASFFMQNLDTTHRDDIRQNHDLLVPAGRGKTSFIDVRDIGAVAALALTREGHANKAYDLTGSEALDYYQVAALFTEVLGRPITYSNPSPLKFFLRWRKRKLPIPYILVMIALYTTVRLGRGARLAPDTENLLKRPPITMHHYIEDYKQVWL